MPAIQRRRKEAKRPPFEQPLFPSLLPDFSGAVARQNTNHLLIKMPLRIESAAGRDLRDVHPRLTFHPVEMDEGAAAAETTPGTQLQFAHILDAKAFDNGNTFAFHPLAIAGAFQRSQHFFQFRFHGGLPTSSCTVHRCSRFYRAS